LDRYANLKPNTDYRSVYASVLNRWLDADSNEILGGSYEDLGFVAAPAAQRTTSGLNPSITSSVFTHRGEIVRLYLACLGRLPDSAGHDNWVRARRSGLGLVEIAESLASSPEFTATYGPLSNREFVTTLYQNVLGRAPDPGGLAHWESVLASGQSRGSVVTGLSESGEFVSATRDQVELVDRSGPIARLYIAYFKRQPDRGGLRYWIGTGLGLGAISDQFAASAEFQQTYGSLEDDQFIDMVYHNVMDRPADPVGRDYWLGAMRAGTKRGQVMTSFSEASEFITKTGTIA